MERDRSSNGNEPTTLSTHAKRNNIVGPRREGQGSKNGFKEGRKGKCYNCNRFDHYARKCPHKNNSPMDDDNNNNTFKGNGNQRNNKFNNKGKRNLPTTQNRNGQPTIRTRNAKYDESNVV